MSGVMQPQPKPGMADQAMQYWQMYQAVKGGVSGGDKSNALERRKKKVMDPREQGQGKGRMPGLGG